MTLKNFILISLVAFSCQPANGFKAAVFEHAQQSYMSFGLPEDIIKDNLEYYKAATNFARSEGAELIVFPEYGLFPPIESRMKLKAFLENIPDPNSISYNPCQEPETFSDKPILYTLSCLARRNGVIIVANMGDVQPCKGEKECPKDGEFHFNTNVAFGRDGKVLAKYNKEHLFNESGMDIPLVKQNPTFQTDLGRFATFVCFDIIFKKITEVARWEGVKAILLPTMWMNSSPMYAAHQYFEAWAFGNNITLLAANVQLPGQSGIGSGIMKGREGAKVYTFNPDGKSKLLITDITKNDPLSSAIYLISKNNTKKWTHDGKDVGKECSIKVLGPAKNINKDYRCLERDTTNISLVKLVKTSDRIGLCNNDMCCMLDYSVNEMHEDFYMGVFNGTFNALNRYFFAEENCFLARCDKFKNKTCVTFPMRSETIFYKLYLKANFSTEFIYPTVMESGMRLMPTNQWKYQSNEKTAAIDFRNASGKNLLTVGLKARAYKRDPPYVR